MEEVDIKKMNYTQAKNELEQIVTAIESGKLDIDALTNNVKRASELISFCKQKLTKTDKELQKILDDIE
jgi:exodeoxyribonuclease VII small subunit